MKRVLSTILCLFLFIALSAPSAFAEGDGNMNGGGGGMGNGTNDNIWHDGEDGVRVTVVRSSDNKPVSAPIDLTNRNENNVEYYFKKNSKLHYRNGASIALDGGSYGYKKPDSPMPRIISDHGNANIVAIKSYFTDQQILKNIANIIGASYDTLINGNYKLLIEPVAYFTFQGNKYAMTATEAALYDQKLSGGLRSKMISLTHQNLPLSIFLEKSDMGWPAYKGSTTKAQSDSTIISSLGLGIVKFKPDGGGSTPEPPDDGSTGGTANAEYRVNTDVITSVTLSAGSEINPDKPAKVTFKINGGTYTVSNIVIPKGESQLVWVKWHTPSSPKTVKITVSASKGSLSAKIVNAKVVSLSEKDPPNPTAKDRNNNFSLPTVPKNIERTASSWGVWSGKWIPVLEWKENWVWVGDETTGHWADHGKWIDNGYWQYSFTSYHATLSANMVLSPDDKVPTASGKLMRSGYGVKINVGGTMKSSASTAQYTGAQTAVTYFPEFAYNTYWRLLDLTQSGTAFSFAFKNNMYSTYNRRVHFTPVWYPDGKYTAYTYLEDAWTPAGMLSMNLDDYVTINGSVYDDWHIGPKMVD